MTYSIVAYDREAGEFGVAVQTCNLAVGTWVPWAESGVGAVATQSHADRTYGTLGLAMMRAGKSANNALDALLAADHRRGVRQVAMIGRKGDVAAYTGRHCLPYAGHQIGDSFSVQANMMASATVWPAMADAYTQAKGDLAAQMLDALDAAQAEGGDIRGQQSAALLVVGNQRSEFPRIDLRVDHHPQPLAELRRMLDLHHAYSAEYAVADRFAEGDLVAASALLDEITAFAPDEAYLQFLRAYHLAARLDRFAEGLALIKELAETDPLWIEYLRRDARSDTFDAPGLAQRFLRELDAA